MTFEPRTYNLTLRLKKTAFEETDYLVAIPKKIISGKNQSNATNNDTDFDLLIDGNEAKVNGEVKGFWKEGEH